MPKTNKIKIPKELRGYYGKTGNLEDVFNEPMIFDNFVKYVLLLHRHKKMTANDVIKSIEHYCSNYDGENPFSYYKIA